MIKLIKEAWLILFLALMLNIACLTFAETISYEQLKEISKSYYKQNKYDDFLLKLNEYKSSCDGIEEANIDYFITVTYLKKLENAEGKQNWEQYYKIVDDYLPKVENFLTHNIEKFKGNKIGLESQYLLCRIYRYQEETAKESQAIEDLSAMIENYYKENGNIEIFRTFADRLQKDGKKKEVKKINEKYLNILAEYDDSEQKIKQIADGYFDDGDYDLSSELYFKLLELMRKNDVPVGKVGEEIIDKYFKTGLDYQADPDNYEKAKFIYEYVLEICKYLSTFGVKSEQDKFNYKAAVCLKELNRLNEAESILQKLIANSEPPLRQTAIRKLISVYDMSGEANSASKLEKMAESASPDDLSEDLPEVYFSLAKKYLYQGDYIKAENIFRKILFDYPGYDEAWIIKKYLIVVEERMNR